MEPGPLLATAQERQIRHGSFSGYHPVAAGAKKKNMGGGGGGSTQT